MHDTYSLESPLVGLGFAGMMIALLIGVVMALLVVIPFWFICKKAGLSPWLSLIMLIPFGALVLPFIVAFIDWPVLRSRSQNIG